MGLIKNLQRYILKPIPVPEDFVIGSDSENFGKTVSFSLESLGFGEGEPGLQNNRIFIIWAESVVSGSPEAQIAASINSRVNTVEVLYDQIPIIKAFTVIDAVVYELSYGIIGKGKGVYGQGGTVTLTAGDLTLINTRVVFQIPSLENPSVRLFDLGEIADGDFIAVINQGNYTIEAGDVVFFEFTELGVRNLYSFIGDPGDYGLNETQMTLSDVFLVVSDETPSNTGAFIPLSGTTEGNPVTGNIEFESNSFLYRGATDLSNLINDGFSWIGFRKKQGNIEGFVGILSEDGETGDPKISYYNTSTGAYYLFSVFGWEFKHPTQGINSISFDVDGNAVSVGGDPLNTGFKGIIGGDYYGANYDDNTYVQKKYVDDAIRQDSAVIRQKITITGSAFRTLNSSPVTLIPAPGAGKIIQLNKVLVSFVYGSVTANYATGGIFSITYLTNSGSPSLNSTSNSIRTYEPPSNIDITENTPIILSAVGSDATVGDSTLNVYVTYEIITL